MTVRTTAWIFMVPAFSKAFKTHTMKLRYLPLLFLFTLTVVLPGWTQDNDGMYFNAKDRELYQKNNPARKKEKKQEVSKADPNIANLQWTMTCKGMTSQSEKVFVGNSFNFLNSAKELEDSLKTYFKTEKVSIAISQDSTSLLLTDTLSYRDIRTFFSDKVKNLSSCEKMTFSYPEWLTPLIVEKSTQFAIDQAFPAPEGSACLKIAGKKKGTICSFSKYFKNDYANSYVSVTSPNSPADQTWIFFYAYGSGDSTDQIQLMVYQTVYKKGLSTTILQKAFTYKIPLNFIGWKPVSIRYSDLQIPEGMDDTTQKFPKDLASIEFSLVTQSENGEASVYLDHIMILANR